jgi:hypothetical protein
MSKMQSLADGVKHCEAVLVVSAHEAIYLPEVSFYLRGRKVLIREIGLHLTFSPPDILVTRLRGDD